MKKNEYIFLLVVSGLWIAAGCSSTPTTKFESGTNSNRTNAVLKRTTPVVSGRPARMYVWVGFDEKTCMALNQEIAVSEKPAKGAVSFKPNQKTKIKQSNSGKCLGENMVGTGIYYTARKGQTGVDQFSVTASTSEGHSATRSFQVRIVE